MTKLWLLLGSLGAQTVLPLTRLVWYSDGRVYWVREALVPALRGEVTVKVPGLKPPTFLLPQADYRPKAWTLRPDTVQVPGQLVPASLDQLVEQSVGVSVAVVYLAGAEWEEISGLLEGVTPTDLFLRKATDEQVVLPRASVRAVRRAAGPFVGVFPAWRLSVRLDTTLPLARVTVAGWDTLAPWGATHLLQLTTPTRALLHTTFELPASPFWGEPVELFLVHQPSEAGPAHTWHLPLQKISPSSNRLPFLQAELSYSELYRVSLPDLVESLEPFQLASAKANAERSLQLLNSQKVTLPPGPVQLLDAEGLPIARSGLPLTPPGTTGYLPLAPDPAIQLRLQESETRREKDRSTPGALRVGVQGTLSVQNSTPREVRLRIEKPLTGRPSTDKLGFGQATPLPERRAGNPRYLLQWELLLRPGATESLDYAYELTLPPK
ncbi:MAG: hypothetical protein D6750_05055 [Bacteroidetes bacterium]|nr:MAG: hypothetical protein D6750_05055 [Bacteroidota bacterium]